MSTELRDNIQSTRVQTHYENGQVSRAMAILAELRTDIRNAIFDFCEVYSLTPKRGNIWQDVLAEHLLPNFLGYHAHIPQFTEANIRKNCGRVSYFFNELSELFAEYRNEILGNHSLKKKDIHPGWGAIIREFGLFNQIQGSVESSISKIRHCSGSEIRKIVNNDNPNKKFLSGQVCCPAEKQVRDHFVLCVSLNVGLIRFGLYSEKNRIDLLQSDNEHFKSPEDMTKEYDLKIAQCKTP